MKEKSQGNTHNPGSVNGLVAIAKNLNYPMKPYEKTTIWVAKIVTYPDDWNTRYMEDKWDDYTFYATRDLAMKEIWKATTEYYGCHTSEATADPTSDDFNQNILADLVDIGLYDEDFLEGEYPSQTFRKDLRHDKWPYPHSFRITNIDSTFQVELEEMFIHLPPEE